MRAETLIRAKVAVYKSLCREEPDRYYDLKYRAFQVLGALRLYESEHLRFLLKAAKPGDRAYDLGAHFGVYTRLLSKAVGPHGRVVAVDPSPPCVVRLLGMAEQRGNIDVVPVAIGSAPGSMTLRMPLLGGLVPETALAQIEEINENTRPEDTVVDVITLRDLVDQYGKPDLLKADVEGQDAAVIEGLLTLPIEALPRIVLLEAWNLESIQSLLNDLAAFAGYRPAVIRRGRLRDISPGDRKDPNIYLVRSTS